jgi:acyl-CoA synthetase (NDP forming)
LELPGADASSGVLSPRRRTLDAFFNRKTVAVIGASETPRSVGRKTIISEGKGKMKPIKTVTGGC